MGIDVLKNAVLPATAGEFKKRVATAGEYAMMRENKTIKIRIQKTALNTA